MIRVKTINQIDWSDVECWAEKLFPRYFDKISDVTAMYWYDFHNGSTCQPTVPTKEEVDTYPHIKAAVEANHAYEVDFVDLVIDDEENDYYNDFSPMDILIYKLIEAGAIPRNLENLNVQILW